MSETSHDADLRRRFETTELAYQDQIAQLTRRLQVLYAEREEILRASDETRRYELPRLAAMVEVERSRAQALEQEGRELEAKVAALQGQLQASEDHAYAREQLEAEDAEESAAEQLLLELDSRLHALEASQAFSRETTLESQHAADEETLKLALEQYAQAEERAARLSAIEDAVWALADGDVDPRQLEALRARNARPSPALLELLQQCVERQSWAEVKLDEMVAALRQTQELLAEEVRARSDLQREVARLQRTVHEQARRQAAPDPSVPWPLPQGASTQDLNRVLEALRSEGEQRERATHTQVERLSQATRAALERLANLLDAALAGVGSAEPIPLDELDRLLERSSLEAAFEAEEPYGWTPTVLPPYVEEELSPEELEPDDEPEPEPEPEPEAATPAPSPAATWFEVETERSWPPRAEAEASGDPGPGWTGEDRGRDWDQPRHETWEDLEEDREQVAGTVARMLGKGGAPLVEQDYVEALDVPAVAEDEGELLLDMPDDSEVLEGEDLVLMTASDSEGEEALSALEAAQEADDWLAGEGDDGGGQAASDWLSSMAQSLEASAATGTPRDASGEELPLDDAPEGELLVAPAPGQPRAPETDEGEPVSPADLQAEIERARGSQELTTRRLARGLISAMRSGEELQVTLEALRSERDNLQSKAKEAEKALESEVWRGLATHRELLAARERLQELEQRLNDQLERVEAQQQRPQELEQVLERPLPGMPARGPGDGPLIQETMDLRREVEDRDSVLHWLLLEADPKFHDTKSRAIRACETALEDLSTTPSGPQRAAEEERVQELLHWLRSERDEARGASAPPVDF